jgi:hypothetical protein
VDRLYWLVKSADATSKYFPAYSNQISAFVHASAQPPGSLLSEEKKALPGAEEYHQKDRPFTQLMNGKKRKLKYGKETREDVSDATGEKGLTDKVDFTFIISFHSRLKVCVHNQRI